MTSTQSKAKRSLAEKEFHRLSECANCELTAAQKGIPKLQICSACKQSHCDFCSTAQSSSYAKYLLDCSRECQRANYSTHKALCKDRIADQKRVANFNVPSDLKAEAKIMTQDLRAFSLVHKDFTLTIAMWYAFDLFSSYEGRLDRILIIKLERRPEEKRPERLYQCIEIYTEPIALYESRMGSISAMVKRSDDRHRGLGNSGAACVALTEDREVGDTCLTGPTSVTSLPIFELEKPIWASLKTRPNFDWKAYIKRRIETGDVTWTGPIPQPAG